MGFYTTPGGGYGATGSADPYFRFRQLERLGGVAQLLMQQAQERQQREEQRLDGRIKLAASAVASGGDINQPAVQGVLNDLRTASTKKRFANEGYDKIADLLQANWQAQQNDPELIQQRAMQHVRRTAEEIMQSYQVPGDRAGMENPGGMAVMKEAFDTATGSGPQGFDAMVGTLGQNNVTRMMYPEAYGHGPDTSDPRPASLQRDDQMLEWSKSDDPTKVAAAAQYFDTAPPPASVAAQNAITSRMRERWGVEDARDDEKQQLAALKGEMQDRIDAWDKEATRRKTSAGSDTTWESENPRPKMPNVADLQKKLNSASAEMGHLSGDELTGIHEYLKQAALRGELERAWQRLKKRPEARRAGAG